ncbi:hypothetical protein [Nocardia vermiculata]|uniref:Uncharacterized protein n=1 Tax=Nocardia vermiculata TaxID=257274 RepID=A0A846XZ02_9NOCA|nr:hypothetical protein [Nocardia vermiculata]NKY49479.1 hypothetical protein [Nocardia vermiculata]
MHRLENSALWRGVLIGLSALGAGFGAMVPLYLNDDRPCDEVVDADWDWSIPHEWFDRAQH